MEARSSAFVVIFAALAVVVAGGLYLGVAHVSGDGRLAVAVHDAPCPGCAHVYVTFTSVSVHASGHNSSTGWTTLNVSGTTVDLEALNGSALAKVIGVTSLPAGHYEQIRLAVTNVSVVLANGTTIYASIPAASSGTVDGSFTISSGVMTTISIDVDLQSSLHVVEAGPMMTATFTPHIGSVFVV